MKTERSFITINLKNLEYNFNNIKEKTFPNEKMACVIKANAYGHGDKVLAKKYEELGINFFCVASLSEAINIREVLKPTSQILILGYTPYDYLDDILKYDLIQTITSEEYLYNAYKYIKNKIKVHLAIDTGMSRIGLQLNEKIDDNIQFALQNYLVDGVFTHMSCADCLDDDLISFTEKQIEIYKYVYNKYNHLIPNFHYKNSASIIRKLPNYGNIVRPGIILYGLNPSDEVKEYIDLKELIEWKSVISSVRTINKGDAVGYGNTYYADKDIKVATISTGYADGYSRSLSNKGYVLINGQRANIIGRVCMDQFMVDVTNIDNVESGMLATLIGKDKDNQITINDIAKLCNTINYEIVCLIAPRVKRIYINE